PEGVIGPGYGAKPGEILTNVLLYAPFDGKVSKPLYDGKKSFFAPYEHEGRNVAAQTVELAPGATHTVTYTVTTGAGQTSSPHVDLTPGFADTGTVKVAAPTC
ncbi:MAG: hypothetical protein WAK18_08160, partial [Nocardioidaceae bacterium]